MVIEYIGEIIRSELAESREKQYEAKVSFVLSHMNFFNKKKKRLNFS